MQSVDRFLCESQAQRCYVRSIAVCFGNILHFSGKYSVTKRLHTLGMLCTEVMSLSCRQAWYRVMKAVTIL